MKLTEQEQAAVSRGMIEGLLRALRAEGMLPPDRLELVHCSALFQSVQDQFRDKIRPRSALKEVLTWLRISLCPVI